MDKKPMIFTIHGVKIPIEVESGDELNYPGIVESYEEKLRIASQMTADTYKQAIIAGIFLAEEWHRVRDNNSGNQEVVDKKLDELLSYVDTQINHT